MYPAPFEYFSPRSVEEALALLERLGDEAKILAGGQSLLPMMKLRIAAPRYLVDISRIENLGGVRREGGRLVIGALCRHADVAASPHVREHLPIMVDAANQTADVQVRNLGTVGGSLAHADPAGDWPAALMALDTTVTIAGPAGSRSVPLTDFIIDAYSTRVNANEMLTHVSIGIPARPCGGAYLKFEKRAGDFAVASVGVQVALDGDRFRHVAVSLGALGATPLRARKAESRLEGQVMSPALANDAGRLVREAAEPFSDTRGSVEYKRHLADVLFQRSLVLAVERARRSEGP